MGSGNLQTHRSSFEAVRSVIGEADHKRHKPDRKKHKIIQQFFLLLVAGMFVLFVICFISAAQIHVRDRRLFILLGDDRDMLLRRCGPVSGDEEYLAALTQEHWRF